MYIQWRLARYSYIMLVANRTRNSKAISNSHMHACTMLRNYSCRINSGSLESEPVTTYLKELLTAAKEKPSVEGITFQARYYSFNQYIGT